MAEETSQYKMIGADGVEYGPASAAEVSAWIQEGRASAKTLVRKTSEPNWRKLGEFAEFAAALAAKAQAQQLANNEPPKNKLARMGFTLSLASLLCFCLPLAPFGLAASVVALFRIKRNTAPKEGLMFALAGLSIALLVFLAYMLLLLYIPRFFTGEPLKTPFGP
jgi:hypothetical protein